MKIILLGGSMAAIAINLAAPAYAEADDAAQAAAAPGVAEIIVTAQKRGEKVNKIPASISAFKTDTLVDQGIRDTKQLELVTPGLVFTSFNGAAQPYVRGIGAENAQMATESPLATYIDGVYRPALYAGIQDLANTERVEVLLGPQGTLYGRNSTAGAINIITRDPTSTTTMEGSASYGNRNTVRIQAYGSGGTDILAANLGVSYRSHAGFTRDLVDNSRLNDQNVTSGRGKIKYTPNDRFSMTLAMDYTRQRDTAGSAFTYIPSTSAQLANPRPPLSGAHVVDNDPRATYVDPNFSYSNTTDFGAGLTARYEFDDFDLVSITGYSHTRTNSAVDLDTSDQLIAISASIQSQRTASQEFQIISNMPDSRLSWIGGLYAFYSHAGFDILRSITSTGTLYLYGQERTVALAGYGQATYAVTDPFKITFGARFSTEKRTLLRSELGFTPTTIALTTPQQGHRWSDFSPKLTAEYTIGNSLLYATASRGFKSGNYNILGFGAPPVSPEKVTAFEVGGKHRLLDGIVQFNWSGFLYNYKDLQVSTVVGGQVVLQNASKSRIYGADATAAINLGGGFTANLTASWLHARYTSYPNASVYIPDPATGGFGNAFVSRDVSGKTNTRSPKFSGSAGMTYKANVPVGGLTLSGNYYYNSGFYFDSGNTLKQRRYGILNARAELALGETGISLFVYGDNLTNKNVLSGAVQIDQGNLGQYTDPRLYGVGVRVKF